MTALEYIEEVKRRLNRAAIVALSNDQLLLTYVNKARKEVQRFTMELQNWRYGRISRINISNIPYLNYTQTNNYQNSQIGVYPAILPIDFIREYTVILESWNGNNLTKRSVCRYTTLDELHKIQRSAFNLPTIINPVYTIVFDQVTGNDLCLIAGIDSWLNNNNLIEIWHTVVLKDLEFRDVTGAEEQELVIGPDSEELVTLYAMNMVLAHAGQQSDYMILKNEIRMMEAAIMQNYAESKMVTDMLLASYENKGEG